MKQLHELMSLCLKHSKEKTGMEKVSFCRINNKNRNVRVEQSSE